MIILPILAIALLIYHSYAAIKRTSEWAETNSLLNSARRASDLEQWASIDSE